MVVSTVSFTESEVDENQCANERGKSIANLMAAVACSEVPKVSLIIGGSYGIENYALCGRSFGPNFLYTWPTAKVSLKRLNKPEEDSLYGTARLWDDGIIDPKDTKRIIALSIAASLNCHINESVFPVFRM